VLHGGVDGDERRHAVRSLVGHGGSHRANHMSQPRMPAPTGHRGPPHPRASVGHASFRSSSAIGPMALAIFALRQSAQPPPPRKDHATAL
jgi:hypothetical protein